MKSQVETQPAAVPEPDLPDVMTVQEAAEYLRLSERTVRLHLNAGTMPGWKLGGVWRLSRAALAGHVQTPNTAKGKKPANGKK